MATLLVSCPLKEYHKAAIEAVIPDWEIVFCTPSTIDMDVLSRATVLFGYVKPELVLKAPNLKWLQLSIAGFDRFVGIDASFRLTSAVGAYGKEVAEHLLSMTLNIIKSLHLYRDSQREHHWSSSFPKKTLENSTVMIVGTGDIGSRYARYVKMLGARTIGINRSADSDSEYFDSRYTNFELPNVIRKADIIAITLPLSQQTEKLFDLALLECTNPNAILLNVGRGKVIDTGALLTMLERGWFFGVGLDVVDPEPLAPDHPLSDYERVMITGHVAGNINLPETLDAVVEILLENLARFTLGKPLKNEVDVATGSTLEPT